MLHCGGMNGHAPRDDRSESVASIHELLFSIVSKRTDGIEPCGPGGGSAPGQRAAADRKAVRPANQPERQRKEVGRRPSLLLDVDVRPEVDRAPYGPAEHDAGDAAEEADRRRLDQEDAADVAVAA